MIESIDIKELKGLEKATEQIHVAIQYLSMAGEFLGKTSQDGSHANLGWLAMKEKFITHPFGPKNGYVMEFSPENLTITIYNAAMKYEQELKLKGLSQEEGVKWIKEKLKDLKIDGAKNYKIAPPYELPTYAYFVDKKFKKSPKKGFKTFAKMRSWAEYFATKHSLAFPDAGPPRTWPHHLDHAVLIPLSRLKNGSLSKTIGMGLAIQDAMIDEPYFYVSVWQKDKKIDLSKMKSLKYGSWINEDYKGSVLKLSDVLEAPDFEDKIDTYFKESLKQALAFLKVKPVNGK